MKVVGQGGFKITFVDGTGASGDYVNDTMTIGNTTIDDVQLAVAYNTTTSYGVMGIGYDTNEAGTSYQNIIDVMANDATINSKSYSIWLNDLHSQSGSILFGGIDVQKYTGPLIAVSMVADSNTEYITTSIPLTSLGATGQLSNSTSFTNTTYSEPVLISSGTTYTYLATDLTKNLWDAVGAVNISNQGFVDCNLRNSANISYISYGFGGPSGPKIRVAVPELVFPYDGTITGSPFASTCYFGILPRDRYVLHFRSLLTRPPRLPQD